MIPIWGVLGVIGGFLYHLSLGYYYTVGNMNSYVISYMGITKSQSAWFSSVILACQAIALPSGGFAAKKIGYRLVFIIGILLSSGGILLTRLTVRVGLGAYIFTYCVMFGLGMGFPYSVIFHVASSWFPEKRSTVVGIISAGLGLGALVFTPIQTALINPDDLQPDSGNYPNSVEQRIPNAFLILGGITAAFQVIGVICLRMRPDKQNGEDDVLSRSTGYEEPEDKNSAADYEINQVEDVVLPELEIKSYSVKDALKCIDFYLLFTVSFCGFVSVVLLTSTYKLYGLDNGLKDSFLSGVVIGSSVCNCVGRVIWGLIVDRFSYKCPMLTYLSLWILLFATFPFVAAGPGGMYLFAIWVFLLFINLSGNFVILPGATGALFGPENFAVIYGLVYAAATPSCLLTAAVTSQFNVDGAWMAVYCTCAGFCFVSFVITLFLRDDMGHCCQCTTVCSRICNPCRHDVNEEVKDEDPKSSPHELRSSSQLTTSV